MLCSCIKQTTYVQCVQCIHSASCRAHAASCRVHAGSCIVHACTPSCWTSAPMQLPVRGNSSSAFPSIMVCLTPTTGPDAANLPMQTTLPQPNAIITAHRTATALSIPRPMEQKQSSLAARHSHNPCTQLLLWTARPQVLCCKQRGSMGAFNLCQLWFLLSPSQMLCRQPSHTMP